MDHRRLIFYLSGDVNIYILFSFCCKYLPEKIRWKNETEPWDPNGWIFHIEIMHNIRFVLGEKKSTEGSCGFSYLVVEGGNTKNERE